MPGEASPASWLLEEVEKHGSQWGLLILLLVLVLLLLLLLPWFSLDELGFIRFGVRGLGLGFKTFKIRGLGFFLHPFRPCLCEPQLGGSSKRIYRVWGLGLRVWGLGALASICSFASRI